MNYINHTNLMDSLARHQADVEWAVDYTPSASELLGLDIEAGLIAEREAHAEAVDEAERQAVLVQDHMEDVRFHIAHYGRTRMDRAEELYAVGFAQAQGAWPAWHELTLADQRDFTCYGTPYPDTEGATEASITLVAELNV